MSATGDDYCELPQVFGVGSCHQVSADGGETQRNPIGFAIPRKPIRIRARSRRT